MGYHLNFSAVWRHFDELLWGLGLSLVLAVRRHRHRVASAFGAVGPMSPAAGSSGWRSAYVEFIRKRPSLLVLFSSSPCRSSASSVKTNSFVLALSIYAGAYLAEVFRAGLLGVPRGLREAGMAIGLTQANPLSCPPADHAAHRAALARQHLHLAVQGHLARRGDRRARSSPSARKINVDTFRVIETWLVDPALPRHLLRSSRPCCAGSRPLRGPARRSGMTTNLPWSRSSGRPAGRSSTGSPRPDTRSPASHRRAALVVGLVVGMALTYGHFVPGRRWRLYTDFIRGTPVLVLVFVGYYVLPAVGMEPRRLFRPAVSRAHRLLHRPGRRDRPRRPPVDPNGQMEAGKAIGLTFAQRLAMSSSRRRCAASCRPGSTAWPRW